MTGTLFDEYDMFSVPVNSFHLEGQEKIGTSIGFIFSIFMSLVVLSQVIVQGYICATKDRPLFTQTTLENGRNYTDTVDLKKFNFTIAFGVRNANTKAFLHDPNYVEFVPIMEEKKLNWTTPVYTPLSYHRCTAKDYKLFHPINGN